MFAGAGGEAHMRGVPMCEKWREAQRIDHAVLPAPPPSTLPLPASYAIAQKATLTSSEPILSTYSPRYLKI